ncbi:aminotransferase class I/II-fold pyridoxal phosphate-dependent enzyme [Methylobacterium currus]|uniref:aminotransferase class I/II-fold pyridoxal phosphate-dependent enzyme n=1 Tax=Methylobacterium currus TaxID=2051553 RepID=UPI001E48A333|nr:aminotransferase class I/II-fold pyridoxal phosphate-dependent enzyme [Methylobacterium currus]UHC19750.1 aminotransferase class I/II-fold pyridoxal phosphate-dependent enzyme [Methylobacterium currus]
MSAARRRAIVEVCRAHDVHIVEDGVYQAGAGEEPPLVTLAPDRCLWAGSLSKTVSPGLRVGVLVVPPDMVQSASFALQALPFTPSPLSCAVIEDWLANGTIDAVGAELTAEAARRADLATALLRNRPLICRPTAYHAWLPLPRQAAERFTAAAAGLGIAVTPPQAVMTDPDDDDSGIRLCLGGPALRDLTRALTLLSGIGQELPPVMR